MRTRVKSWKYQWLTLNWIPRCGLSHHALGGCTGALGCVHVLFNCIPRFSNWHFAKNLSWLFRKNVFQPKTRSQNALLALSAFTPPHSRVGPQVPLRPLKNYCANVTTRSKICSVQREETKGRECRVGKVIMLVCDQGYLVGKYICSRMRSNVFAKCQLRLSYFTRFGGHGRVKKGEYYCEIPCHKEWRHSTTFGLDTQ